MAGEPLMCVWQAVNATNSGGNYVTPTSLIHVLEHLAKDQNIQYNKTRFNEVFPNNEVEYTIFKEYAQNSLCPPYLTLPSLIDHIEQRCWMLSKNSYKSEALNQEDVHKMWCIFNRLCDGGSYPPIMLKEQATYIFGRIVNAINKSWQTDFDLPDEGLTFQEMIDILDKKYFTVASSPAVRQGIEDIFTWLVREVMKAGWLQKRTRKNANWTNWLKRWFVMTPGKLEYFENCKQKVKKGEVLICSRSMVGTQIDYRSLFSKMEYRFKLTNAPSFEIELCAESSEEKELWLKLLQQNVKSITIGITPQMMLLKQRSAASVPSSKVNNTSDVELENAMKLARGGSRMYDSSSAQRYSEDSGQDLPKLELQEGEAERDKMRKLFLELDTDGNGRIDRKEFELFINKLGTKLKKREVDIIFESVDKDESQCISFEEFMNYFMDCVIQSSKGDAKEARLRAAFLEADRDGSGAINFREFYELISNARQSVALEQLAVAYHELVEDRMDGIHFSEFKKFMQRESSLLVKTEVRSSQNFEEILKNVYKETDAAELAAYLRSRWEKFASFKRYGETGSVVLHGGKGIVDDFVPGNYTFLDLACFNDLIPQTPKKVSLPVKWLPPDTLGQSGKVVFPTDFDGKIPTDIATNEHLAFYGCSLADGKQLKISLLYRHGVQDFTYENNYLEGYVKSDKLLGGAGIEHHGFSHLDCPFEDDSGVFVVGKCEGDILHLTAFKIPTRHTIYVPGGVIHSNDYLKGTWRTMLSDETDILHSQLVKVAGSEKYQHFSFTFKPLIL